MVVATRLGLGVHEDRLAISVLRRGTPASAAVVEREPGEDVGRHLERVLRSVPRRSWQRVELGVAVGDRRCRVVPLFGVLDSEPLKEVEDKFRARPSSFTIAGEERLIAGNAWREDSQWWGVVLTAPLYEALATACDQCNVRLVAIAASEHSAPGDHDARSAEACLLRPSGQRTVDTDRDRRERRMRTVRRLALVGVSVLALVVAWVAPWYREWRETQELERRVARERAALPSDSNRSEEVNAVALQKIVSDLRGRRGHMTNLLNEVAAVLPESTAVVSLRVGERGGDISIVGARVEEAVAILVTVPQLQGARLMGSLLEERFGDLALQRATLSWQTTEQAQGARQ